MDDKTRQEIREIQDTVQAQHPNWPQEKVRWIAMQLVGLIPSRKC